MLETRYGTPSGTFFSTTTSKANRRSPARAGGSSPVVRTRTIVCVRRSRCDWSKVAVAERGSSRCGRALEPTEAVSHLVGTDRVRPDPSGSGAANTSTEAWSKIESAPARLRALANLAKRDAAPQRVAVHEDAHVLMEQRRDEIGCPEDGLPYDRHRVGERRADSLRVRRLRLRGPNFEHRPYEKMVAYGQSKTANVLFAVEADRRYQSDGIRASSHHPGAILETDLARHYDPEELKLVVERARRIGSFKTVEQGAATTICCATSLQLAGFGGVYCENCDIAPIKTEGDDGVRPHAVDPAIARRLWAWSVRWLS